MPPDQAKKPVVENMPQRAPPVFMGIEGERRELKEAGGLDPSAWRGIRLYGAVVARLGAEAVSIRFFGTLCVVNPPA